MRYRFSNTSAENQVNDMEKNNNSQKKKMNPVLGFLFAIVLPVVGVAVIAAVVFTVAGADVTGWAKQTGSSIPVISNFIDSDSERSEQRENEQLRDALAKKEEKVSTLNSRISNLESTMNEMKQEMERLENENEKRAKQLAEKEKARASHRESIQSISSSFTEMDGERAAQILSSTEQDLAISILEQLPNDVRGEILEAMDPEAAAEITQQFVNRP
ncbi:hypothetical protein EU245_04775 [Lentibacillus lipolyticus]|nr:hypothetical protein EU245_04775 [Lentibacillus lipolyticus]